MKDPLPAHQQYPIDINKDTLLFWCFFGLLGTYVIEGPLRYAFVLAGHPNFIYIRDGLAVLSILFIFLRSLLTRNWIEPHLSIVGCILLFHLAIGLFWGMPFFQAFFGFKIFITLLFGVAIFQHLQNRFNEILKVLAFYFFITVIGVFYNYVVHKFPWEGLNYETAFGTVSNTREWWTNSGTRRLPGFARNSFDAAMIAGISGFACLILFKNLLVRIMIAIICFTAIILTTTKGMALAFLVISFWMLFNKHSIFLPMGKILVFVLFILSIGLPSISVYFEIGSAYKADQIPSLLVSLWDRFSWMWPNAFELLTGPEQYLFGGGLGSIGTPQTYGLDERQLNAADNIFVFLFVMCGPLALFYLGYPVWRVIRSSGQSEIAVWIIGFLIICFGYGLTTNMLEQPFFSGLLGMVLGYALNNQQSERKPMSL